MSRNSKEKFSVNEENNLPTIQEETDENITILVDSLDDAVNEAIKTNNFDKFSHLPNNSKLSLNPKGDEYNRSKFHSIKSLSLEMRALLIGVSVIGFLILIGLVIGFILFTMIQYDSEKRKGSLNDLLNYVRI